MSYKPPTYKQLFHSSRRFLAKHWLSLMPTLQIGITGSQGKTNTTRLLAFLLSTLGPTVSTDIDLDSIYNVPITALKVMLWTKFTVFELGIDHPNEMDQHLEIVSPKIAIVTGISPVHTDQEHLGSLENLIKEKRKLIEALPKDGFAILNYDDPNVRKMASYTKAKILWFGTDSKNCDIWVDPKTIKLSLEGTSFILNVYTPEVNVNNKNTSGVRIKTKLIGKHHIYTIMASLLTITAINQLARRNLDVGGLIKAVEEIKSLPGRMSVEPGPLKTIILNDSIRANPASTTAGLQTLSEIGYTAGRKIAVLAEMGELQHPEEEHKKIGSLIPKLEVDFLVCVGPFQKFVADAAIKNGFVKDGVFWVKNMHSAAIILKKIIKKGDLIYLKGSLLRHLERLPMLLNNEKINCNVISCPFYNNCLECKYRYSGYQNYLFSK